MRLVSWNLHGSKGPDLDRAGHALHELEPDVIVLQEVRRHQARRLARVLGDLAWVWALKHRPLGWVAPWRAEGLAMLSRAAVTGSAWAELTPSASRSSHRRRIAMYADTSVDGSTVRVVNVHLAAGQTEEDRQAQADRLVANQWLSGDPPTVLAGDVNTEAELPAFVAATLAESDSAVQATYPSHEPRWRIDRVFVSAGSGLRIVEVDVPEGSRWVRFSDHRPVVVDIALPGDTLEDDVARWLS